MLQKAVDNLLNGLNASEFELKETHAYTQTLPAKYYEEGSHSLNRSVAFALKHTDERLFLSWIMLRSKASDFDYNTIPELYSTWNKHFNKKASDGFTKGQLCIGPNKTHLKNTQRSKRIQSALIWMKPCFHKQILI